jgi:hypothetical protein
MTDAKPDARNGRAPEASRADHGFRIVADRAVTKRLLHRLPADQEEEFHCDARETI